MANRSGLSSSSISNITFVVVVDDCSSNKLNSCCLINDDVGRNFSKNRRHLANPAIGRRYTYVRRAYCGAYSHVCIPLMRERKLM